MKGGITLEPGVGRPEGLVLYTRLCARALALAHARSGDAAAIAGYLGTTDQFDRAIESFAATYADQTERDPRSRAAASRRSPTAASERRPTQSVVSISPAVSSISAGVVSING